jgi:4'-phosphopantetheinyl transferase
MGALDGEQQKKVNAYRQEDDALRSLAGQLLIRHIADGKPVTYTAKGKPSVEGGPFFNVSHSGNYAAAVVSDTAPVGIDLEFAENTRGGNFSALAKAAFHPEELQFYNENPDRRHFYEIWTRKEAFAKMKGEGLGIGLKTFSILEPSLSNPNPGSPPAYTRLFHDLPSYIIAVCSTEPVKIKTLTALSAKTLLQFPALS